MIDVKKAINQVVDQFKRDPLIIHSEKDIQALLYNALLIQEQVPQETGYEYEGKYLRTNRVHCEYQGKKGNLLDIIVFKEDAIKQIKHKSRQLYVTSNSGKVPSDALIEIKFENGEKNNSDGVRKDIKKLRAAWSLFNEEYGISPELYMIYFIFYWKNIGDNKLIQFMKDLSFLTTAGIKVNMYITLGPRKIWENIIQDSGITLENINFEYTV